MEMVAVLQDRVKRLISIKKSIVFFSRIEKMYQNLEKDGLNR